MDANEAEKAKALRVQIILYGMMFVMVLAPLVIYYLRSRR
jgi:hypothetical protein